MDATSFELNVTVPADERFAAPMGDLAVHAARYAGCRGPDADAYGEAVRAVVLACLARPGRAALVEVIIRRGNGPVEFLVACDERLEAVPAGDRHITVGWTREGGRQMCRVARSMPQEQ